MLRTIGVKRAVLAAAAAAVLAVGLVGHAAAAKPKPKAGPAKKGAKDAPYITAIAIDSLDIPVLLDSNGEVWVFKEPLGLSRPIKLPGLKNITKIAPYMALDKDGRVYVWSLGEKTDFVDEGDLRAEYAKPTVVEEIQHATELAYGGWHLLAAQEDGTVWEWREIPSTKGFQLAGYEKPRQILERKKVRSLAASTYGTAVLYEDGTLVGTGLRGTGQSVRKNQAVASTVAFDVPKGQAVVFLGNFHLATLSEEGTVRFWGGCDYEEKDLYGASTGPVGIVAGAVGPVDGVSAVAMAGNDNEYRDVFLKQDGTVWGAFAPLPPGTTDSLCGFVKHKTNTPERFEGMAVPAVMIANGNHTLLALGKDHTLWSSSANPYVGSFNEVNIELVKE